MEWIYSGSLVIGENLSLCVFFLSSLINFATSITIFKLWWELGPSHVKSYILCPSCLLAVCKRKGKKIPCWLNTHPTPNTTPRPLLSIMAGDFKEFAHPNPTALYSEDYFKSLTFLQASGLNLPAIGPPHSCKNCPLMSGKNFAVTFGHFTVLFLQRNLIDFGASLWAAILLGRTTWKHSFILVERDGLGLGSVWGSQQESEPMGMY